MYIEYLKSFVYGVLFGIPFCLAAGPVFFMLIQAGVNKGVKYALSITYGVVLADILLINITYFFVDTIHGFIVRNYTSIQIVIAVLLFVMGLISIFKKVSIADKEVHVSMQGKFLYFANGFVLNALNPSNSIVWIGVNSKLINDDRMEHLLFYTAALLTIAALMMTLSFLSKKIQPLLNHNILRKVNISLGIVYIVFSLTLILGGNRLHDLLQ